MLKVMRGVGLFGHPAKIYSPSPMDMGNKNISLDKGLGNDVFSAGTAGLWGAVT